MTPDVIARIYQVIGKGATYSKAAAAGGISRRTLYNWLERGQKDLEDYEDRMDAFVNDELPEPPEKSCYAEFYWNFGKFEAQLCEDMLDEIIKAAKDPRNWAAAMTLLERRFPDEYGRRGGDGEGQPVVKIVIEHRTDWRGLGQGQIEILNAHSLPDDDEPPVLEGSFAVPALPAPGPDPSQAGSAPV